MSNFTGTFVSSNYNYTREITFRFRSAGTFNYYAYSSSTSYVIYSITFNSFARPTPTTTKANYEITKGGITKLVYKKDQFDNIIFQY